jgi:hypothetical protein
VAICAVCFSDPRMQKFGEPLFAGNSQAGGPIAAQYLEKGPNATAETGGNGAANVVMGVLLDYRAYDTLGEATVIFTSIIGAYVVLRTVGRKKKDSLELEASP